MVNEHGEILEVDFVDSRTFKAAQLWVEPEETLNKVHHKAFITSDL